MNIIDSSDSLNRFIDECNKSIVIPIFCNDVDHPVKNKLSLLIFVDANKITVVPLIL